MKKIFASILLIIILKLSSFAQDIIDPYKNYNNFNPNVFPNELFFENFNSAWQFNMQQDITNYTGEYEIDMSGNDWGSPYVFAGLIGPYPNFCLTAKMEIVSFPFSPKCAFSSANPCGDFSNVRNLHMPLDPYNASNKKWAALSLETPPPGMLSDVLQGIGYPEMNQDLASIAYKDVVDITPAILDVTRTILPHTVLKHTVYLHCGEYPTDPVITSFSWIYDNTRGRMRWYPFVFPNDPSQSSNVDVYDIVFRPEFLFLNSFLQIVVPQPPGNRYEHPYNFNLDNQLANYSTLDYFPYSEIPNPSGCGLPYSLHPSGSDYFGKDGYSGANGLFLPPFALLSAPARNEAGSLIAGYDLPASGLQNRAGIKHDYFIDKGYPDLDLNWINPNDKNIFNPSEVAIDPAPLTTPINLIFPTGYTFKTILGKYPSWQEINDANTGTNGTANGGPFLDLRDVPVPVNASDGHAGDPDYPEVMWDDPLTTDATGFLNDERYGYYYIKNLGQITVEPCVRIFDAKFTVAPGATLIFDDYPSTLNPARFFIKSTGGAVAKNLSTHQYLQNTTITQPQLITYNAAQQIHAGTNVDPDPNAVDLPYIIESGGNIEFVAQDYIRLSDGFAAKSGSSFHAHIATVPSSSSGTCPAWATSSGSRFAEKHNSQKQDSLLLLIATPNPSTGKLTLTHYNKPIEAQQLQIMDTYGRAVFSKTNYNSAQDVIDFSTQPNGIYIARCITNGAAQQVKFVVNK